VNVNTIFEVRSFTRTLDNSKVLKKYGQYLDTPTLPFLSNFSWAFVRMDPVNVMRNLQSVDLLVPELIAIILYTFVWRLRTSNLRKGGIEGPEWYLL